jgi:predicted DNA-binding transcriptional regulator AlpA
MNQNDERLWDVADVAAYLQMPIAAIYKMTSRKTRGLRIPTIHLGGKLRFRRSDIDRWLDALTVSNLQTLTKLKRSVHGDHSSSRAP